MAGVPEEELHKFIGKSNPAQNDTDFEVWEENWLTFNFFTELSTQWFYVSGMNGSSATGINYQSIESMMRIKNIPRKTQATLFAEIQIMEREALVVMNKKPKGTD